MATAPLKCPRCSGAITASPDVMGLLVCPGCGAKLRSKAPVVVKVQSSTPPPARPPAELDSVLARLDSPPNPSATLPPGTPLKKIPRPGEPAPPGNEQLLVELRALRALQEEILAILKGDRGGPPAADVSDEPFTELDEEPALALPVLRSRRRKTVLLIDDDEEARQALVAALARAEVPVKTAVDGSGGLAAIAMEKPDVIVMELDLTGSMTGKDVINMIKATMEWVDVPIVLYTRVRVESQKEARTVHGADEFVPKQQGPDALVAKVIQVFRR